MKRAKKPLRLPVCPLTEQGYGRGSKVEKSAAGALEGFQAGIEVGFLAVDLVDAPAKLANLGHQSRIVIEQPHNGISTLSTRCKQFGGFDGVCVDLKSASHNPRYIKFGSEML